MTPERKTLLSCLALSLLWCAVNAEASSPAPVQPSARDKCPVCGMFIAKYPDWVAELRCENGKTVLFDGAKDFFKYFFNSQLYNPGGGVNKFSAAFVTDYYQFKLIDAYQAFFVIGSNMYGPMGKELIPFATREDAEEFMRDHHGRQILRFREVTPELIRNLD